MANLNELAAMENWDDVVPNALQKFSKHNGNWIAAPVNVHSTNWVWANKAVMDELGLEIPETWDEYIEALEAVKASGRTALAHGGQAWQDATIFDGVVISVGGPEFYKKTMIDLDQEALMSDQMLEVFNRMALLRTYVDDNFSGKGLESCLRNGYRRYCRLSDDGRLGKRRILQRWQEGRRGLRRIPHPRHQGNGHLQLGPIRHVCRRH